MSQPTIAASSGSNNGSRSSLLLQPKRRARKRSGQEPHLLENGIMMCGKRNMDGTPIPSKDSKSDSQMCQGCLGGLRYLMRYEESAVVAHHVL